MLLSALSLRWRRPLLAAAVLWFVVVLLISAPATVAARLLHWLVPQLQLAAVEGSFWRGSARQAFVDIGNPGGDARRLALGRVEWNLNGWSLLWLHPSAKVSAQWGEQLLDTRVRISPLGQVQLRELRAALPADLLRIWAPVPVRGIAALDLDRVDLRREQLQHVQGAIDWRGAQWQWGERWLALGDYRIDIATRSDGTFAGKIRGGNDLGATGSFTANTGRKNYAVDAQLSVSRALPQEFRDSLVFLLRAQPVNAANAGGPVAMRLQRSGSW